jgi:long-chain acyl-CoA synthetase
MDFRRLFDILPYQQARFPKKIALAHKAGINWVNYSTDACIKEVNRVSAGLLELGLKRGDTMAIFTRRGCPQWTFLDLGMQQIGVIPVPVHASSSSEEIIHIFKEANILYAVAANRELLEKLQALKPELPMLKGIFTLQKLPDAPGWEQLIREPSAKHLEALQGLRAAIHEDDLATIIYTSGSTGKPKGVMLSHKNIVSNIKATITLIPANHNKRAVSFLPMSHIFERMVTYTYMAVGTSLYYAWQREDLDAFIKEVKPHYFTVVPRFLEKVYDEIVERLNDSSFIIRKIGFWAIKVGTQYQLRSSVSLWYSIQLRLARWLVFNYWRRQLGGRVEGLIVGSAALQARLARLFTAARIPVKEGYGLTETSPVVAFNRFEPGGTQFNTVGIPIPGIEVRIDSEGEEKEGEIWVKGPGVMLGYYKQEAATKEVLMEDGWFRTGDVGAWVGKRFLSITGRKKHIFKTSSGKYIAPQEIENHFKSSVFIEQCLAVGFQRPYVTTLIIPHFSSLKYWCEENNIHWTAPQFMIHNHKVLQLFEAELARLNEELPNHKHSRNYTLLHEPWTVDSGELTPTLKLKRSLLLERYEEIIEQMYAQ